MNSLTLDRKSLRPWLVLLGCCMMQGGSMGVVMNTMGLFFTAVSQDLGFPVGGISFYKTVAGLSSCMLLPFVGKVLYRYDTRLTLSISAVVMALCIGLMSLFQQLWQWYAASFFLGIASAMLLTTSEPIILANWFHEKLGLAIGVSAAFSGLLGMICNMAFERVISLWGWRMGYAIAAAVCAGMILPMTVFVVRLKPEMVGRQPYGIQRGAEEPEEQPLEMGKAARLALLSALFLAAGVTLFCVGFSAQIVNYAISMGKTMTTGAFLVSCSMISNAAGKVLLGQINDSKGLKWACAVGFAFCIPAFLLLYSGNIWAMTVGSLCYGVGMALAIITPPLLTRKFFRGSDYPKAFSMVMMLATLASSFSTGILGWMYDVSGNYNSALALCLGMCAAFALLCAGMQVCCRRLENRKNYANKEHNTADTATEIVLLLKGD